MNDIHIKNLYLAAICRGQIAVLGKRINEMDLDNFEVTPVHNALDVAESTTYVMIRKDQKLASNSGNSSPRAAIVSCAHHPEIALMMVMLINAPWVDWGRVTKAFDVMMNDTSKWEQTNQVTIVAMYDEFVTSIEIQPSRSADTAINVQSRIYANTSELILATLQNNSWATVSSQGFCPESVDVGWHLIAGFVNHHAYEHNHIHYLNTWDLYADPYVSNQYEIRNHAVHTASNIGSIVAASFLNTSANNVPVDQDSTTGGDK